MPGTQPVALTASQAGKEATTSTTSAAASALPSSALSSSKVATAITSVAGAGATLPRGTGARGQAAPPQGSGSRTPPTTRFLWAAFREVPG